MPVEILEHILVHLDDKSLLRASHVCKSFAAAAQLAFAQKYSNEYYNISGHEKPFQKVMLQKFGSFLRRITTFYTDQEMDDLITVNCICLKEAQISYAPNMIQLSGLDEVSLENVDNLDQATFTEFLTQNQQLKTLTLDDDYCDLVVLLDRRLTRLNKLEYIRLTEVPMDLWPVKINSLEELKATIFQNASHAPLLRALEL